MKDSITATLVYQRVQDSRGAEFDHPDTRHFTSERWAVRVIRNTIEGQLDVSDDRSF